MPLIKADVTYSRTVRPADFESKTATIVFTNHELEGAPAVEGDDIEKAVRDQMRMLVSVVHDALGLPSPKEKTAEVKVETTGRGISDTPEDRQDPEEDTRTPGQKAAATRKANKAKKAAEEAAAAEDETEGHILPKSDDLDLDDEPPVDDDEINLDDTVEDETEVEVDPTEEESHDEITDTELQAEINMAVKSLRANDHSDAPGVVKAAIAAFNTEGVKKFSAGQLNQSQRRKLIAKINAIEVS